MPALSLSSTLVAFALQCLMLSGAGLAAGIWRRRLTGRVGSPVTAVALATLAPCVLGYAAFACYFIHPLLGRVFSWLAVAAVLGTLAHAALRRRHEDEPSAATTRRLAFLNALAGIFYLSALLIYPKPSFTATSAQRFLALEPHNPEIPRIFAERLYLGMSPKHISDGWLSSDRPPLQTGVALVTLPALRALGFGYDKACGTAGTWFQLLWIPALWAFLRWLGLTERAATAGSAVAVFSGFLLLNSVYVGPGLAAGALVLTGFCSFFADGRDVRRSRRGPLLGALAGCGALAHGGVLFSLLALVPFAFLSARRRRRQWKLAGAVFALLALPWLAYQQFYEPPGNRLLKWHLAGQMEPDNRGLVATLADQYRALGWEQAAVTRAENLRHLLLAGWDRLPGPTEAPARDTLRADEFSHLLRTPAAWLLGMLAAPWLVWRHFHTWTAWRTRVRRHVLALIWLGLTLAVWVALMFRPGSTIAPQGSYVAPLLLLGVLLTWTLVASRAVFVALAIGQAAFFAFIWLPGEPGGAAATPFPLAATVCFGLAVAAFAAESLMTPEEAGRAGARLAAMRAWARSPRARLALPALAALVLLFFLRKPHALTTPQLWAEDGTIFLVQAEQLGGHAFTTPYMGYLHTLPRMVAAIAPRLLDPAWWPLFYNGVAFGIWLLVAARIFSPRLDLPGKPWLALALVAVPHSGEVMFNITNVQWITALALVLHPMMAAPQSPGERRADLAILALIALTGPFAIIVLPLFVWRWLRDQEGEGFAPMLVVAGAAALQAWFLHATGPRFAHQDQVLRLWPNIEVIARRLIVWPVLGRDIATGLPSVAVGLLGGTFITAALAWALRPHPLRLARAQIAAAFALMLAAAIARARPDTWDGDNLDFADRYFFLPRVLLVWLLVLEFDAVPRLVVLAARSACLAIVVVHAERYITPAPPDYNWAAYAESIRRGTPAKIPTLPEGWIVDYPGRPDPR
ncbi:MAG: hypothetical protein JNL39_19685 [Opitutaceae bacterium]|nr:hypothetical protein [Opitutaceae bacterium]